MKKAVFPLFLLLFSISTMAQNTQQNDFWDNVIFGGGFGLGFGNNTFNLAVSPSAVYRANQHFATGLGINVNYSKFGDSKLTAYGLSFINFFEAANWLQLSGEFEQWRVDLREDFGGETIKDGYWYPALFMGAGIRQRNVVFGVRYDVLHREQRSIYADAWMPFVRFYF